MEIKAIWKNDLLVFAHVAIKKEAEASYGVYRYSTWNKRTHGKIITSAETLSKAVKKAQLIEAGYRMCQIDRNEL